MAMKNDGVVPYYPDMFNGEMLDMRTEMKCLMTQAKEPMKSYAEGNVDIMYDNGVSPLDSNDIKRHVNRALSNLPLLKVIH